VKCVSQRKTEELGEKPAPVQLRPPQIPHGTEPCANPVLRCERPETTVHRSRVDPRKECESCGNERFRGRKIMFVTIQRENNRPSKEEMNKSVTMLPNCPMFAVKTMNHYVFLSVTNRESSVHLHALYSPRTALRTFIPRRDQLVICGQ
jgi:hypothetical protein